MVLASQCPNAAPHLQDPKSLVDRLRAFQRKYQAVLHFSSAQVHGPFDASSWFGVGLWGLSFNGYDTDPYVLVHIVTWAL